MGYQLLALDLDGTVLDSDVGQGISAQVRQAVAEAQAHGVRVTLATGRMFGSTMPFVAALGICDPIICYQGGMVRHPQTGQIYQHTLMPAEPAAEAAELLIQSDIFVVAYVEERLCVAERRPELATYLHYHHEEVEVVVEPNLPDLLRATPPTKLLFETEPDRVGPVLEQLGERFGGVLSTVRSHARFGELTPLDISKGTALATLAAQLGIEREQVVAIGDHENDIPMLTWAGLGLAMGNAIEPAKRAADAVIPSVREDGVAWAIRRYILGVES